MIRIGLIAGEASGDLLGAGLINEIKQIADSVEVEGIGGERLIAEGMNTFCPMEKLSVMGVLEVAAHYFELKKLRDDLIQYFIENPPDLFIGVDAPDFNLTVERKLKEAGIKTIHYVSPSVWAWREYRLKSIKKSVDLMLTLFPFESSIYNKYKVPVAYVGHPLADRLLNNYINTETGQDMDIPQGKTVIAILPGSRKNEIKHIGAVLLQAADRLSKQNENLYFISGLATKQHYEQFNSIRKSLNLDVDIQFYTNRTHEVLAASNYVLITSGTATLEAMLLNRPMVVAYKLSWLTYIIVKLLAKIPYAALPNILAGKFVVPECMQHQCEPEVIEAEMQILLDNAEKTLAIKQNFTDLSKELAINANKNAAQAVMSLLNE